MIITESIKLSTALSLRPVKTNTITGMNVTNKTSIPLFIPFINLFIIV